MDNSAIRETEFLNNLCTSEISQARRQLGGKFVAELGLPKLKMIQNLFGNEDLVCFELYDWISYLLKYEATDGKVAYHPLSTMKVPRCTQSMDRLKAGRKVAQRSWDYP